MKDADAAHNLTNDELRQMVLIAVSRLGGIGTASEIKSEVVRMASLQADQQKAPYYFDDSFDTFLISVLTTLMRHRELKSTYAGAWKITKKGGDIVRKHSLSYVLMARHGFAQRNSESLLAARNTGDCVADSIVVAEEKDTTMAEVPIPSMDELMNPTLKALRNLGGSGTNNEIHDEVAKILSLSQEQLNVGHNPGPGYKSLILGRLASARTYLKEYGIIKNQRSGLWALSDEGQKAEVVDVEDVKRVRNEAIRRRELVDSSQRSESNKPNVPISIEGENEHILSLDEVIESHMRWRDELSDILHQMAPQSFERFFKYIFREEGIARVEVVNSSGQDEIGGVMSSDGFLTFRVSFKFVRGTDLIGMRDVEDFRRSVRASHSDKGLLITTGSFTQEARRESERGISPAIELIDGQQFIDKLRERSLGITTRQIVVEQVVINPDFFANI